MLGLGSPTRNAFAILACLRQAGDKALTSEVVIAQTGLPPEYLRKTLALLVRAGCVQSRRGTGGGYILARPSECISLLSVVLAVENPNWCQGTPFSETDGSVPTALKQRWAEFHNYLQSCSVADLAPPCPANASSGLGCCGC